MGLEPATSAKDAEWVQEALCRGSFTKVSGAVPREFEASVAIPPPGFAHCLDDRKPKQVRWRAGYGAAYSMVRARNRNDSVINGDSHRVVDGKFWSRPAQYRRLDDGGWIAEEIQQNDWVSLVRVGDSFIHGPNQGSLEPEQALLITKLLHGATTTPESCWFGFWEGYGLSRRNRRCLLLILQRRHYFVGVIFGPFPRR